MASQPQYKLRDDHVACVGHLRTERTRNDLEYHHKNGDLDLGSHRLKGVVVAVNDLNETDVPNLGYT